MKSVIATAAAAAMVGSFLVVGCAAQSAEGTTDEKGVSAASEGLHEAACTTVAPNVTSSGRYYYNANVGSSYGSASCPEQFVLQMNAVPAPAGGGNLSVVVSPATPVTQANCASTEASIDLYGSNNGTTWVHLSSASAFGTWEAQNGIISAGCNYGQYGVFGLSAGTTTYYTNYRVAGAIIQQTTNKGAVVDTPLAMGINFSSLYLE